MQIRSDTSAGVALGTRLGRRRAAGRRDVTQRHRSCADAGTDRQEFRGPIEDSCIPTWGSRIII